MQVGWYSENEGLHLTADLDGIFKEMPYPSSKTTFDPREFNGLPEDVEIIGEEENDIYPLVLNSNDVADRTSYARSLSQSPLTSASTGIETEKIAPERVLVNDNIRTNPLISQLPFPDTGNRTTGRSKGSKETVVETSKVFSYESFIERTWALVVVSVAVFGACVSLWMLVYVFIKMCDGTLAGSNQTMGILLLVGVTCLFARYLCCNLNKTLAVITFRNQF